jgi:hypothetical protein
MLSRTVSEAERAEIGAARADVEKVDDYRRGAAAFAGGK